MHATLLLKSAYVIAVGLISFLCVSSLQSSYISPTTETGLCWEDAIVYAYVSWK
jgi:hypothetical protein